MTNDLAIQPDMTVSAVATRFPDTVPVLARLGIDRCCGGSHSLEFVARAHGLDLTRLLAELEAAVTVGGRR
ncbi:MAG: DUF542 domain-containing protein [Gemmatimonadota bacterium]|nr:DUF542 domain-containing protein [Gemmatimonadota bacterium]